MDTLIVILGFIASLMLIGRFGYIAFFLRFLEFINSLIQELKITQLDLKHNPCKNPS